MCAFQDYFEKLIFQKKKRTLLLRLPVIIVIVAKPLVLQRAYCLTRFHGLVQKISIATQFLIVTLFTVKY